MWENVGLVCRCLRVQDRAPPPPPPPPPPVPALPAPQRLTSWAWKAAERAAASDSVPPRPGRPSGPVSAGTCVPWAPSSLKNSAGGGAASFLCHLEPPTAQGPKAVLLRAGPGRPPVLGACLGPDGLVPQFLSRFPCIPRVSPLFLSYLHVAHALPWRTDVDALS